MIKIMKNKLNVNPLTLKGNEVKNRIMELMNVVPENTNNSRYVLELQKIGPDGKIYGIVRENHEYFIKTANKKKNLVVEDFQYIGGLQNKKDQAYPSYAKAVKELNFKFISLNEALDTNVSTNILENDDEIIENIVSEIEKEEADIELTENEAMIEEMRDKEYGKEPVTIKEHKGLSIAKVMGNIDTIIDDLTPKVKKKVYSVK